MPTPTLVIPVYQRQLSFGELQDLKRRREAYSKYRGKRRFESSRSITLDAPFNRSREV